MKQEITEQKYSRKFGKKLKGMIVFVVIVGLGVAAYHYYTGQKAVGITRQAAGAPAVDIVTLKPQDMVRTVELTGQTVPEAQVDLAAKYSGKIVKINVALGDTVSPGQVLLIQETNDIDIALRQNTASFRQANADAIESNATFEANYSKAQRDDQLSMTNYERYKELYQQGAISKQTLDSAEQQMIAAKAILEIWNKQLMNNTAANVISKQAVREKAQTAVEALQNQREDLFLRAPCSGVIGYRQVEVGNIVQSGQKLLSIVDNSNIYVDYQVSEQDIGQIVLGMATNNTIDALGKTFSGKIIYISPSMDAKTQMFTVRIVLDNPVAAIKNGMFSKTEITIQLRPKTLFVPKEAIVSLNGTDRIFVVDGGNKVVERIVKLGLRNDKYVEILSGIKEGENVAISNLARLTSGMEVKANISVKN